MAKKTPKNYLPKISEHEFQNQILQLLNSDRRFRVFRRNVGMFKNDKGRPVRFGQVGQSDLWGWITEYRCPSCNRLLIGRHFEIEVKSMGGKATAAQDAWLDMVDESGGIAILICPVENWQYKLMRALLGRDCPVCERNSKLSPYELKCRHIHEFTEPAITRL